MKEVARSNPLNTCEIMDGYIIYLNKDYSCLGIHCLGQQQAIIASLFKLEIHKCPHIFSTRVVELYVVSKKSIQWVHYSMY